MKIKLIQIGKTEEKYLQEGIAIYEQRLKHYVKFEVEEIPALKGAKNLSQDEQKRKEGEIILSKVQQSDFVVLMDEIGKEFNSPKFANYLQKRMNSGLDIIFVIGGPFGFSDELYTRANDKVALSQMTLTHQMVRLFFTEQLYRGFTILKGEKYHH